MWGHFKYLPKSSENNCVAQQEVLETPVTEWVRGMILFISLFHNFAIWWYTLAIKIWSYLLW